MFQKRFRRISFFLFKLTLLRFNRLRGQKRAKASRLSLQIRLQIPSQHRLLIDSVGSCHASLWILEGSLQNARLVDLRRYQHALKLVPGLILQEFRQLELEQVETLEELVQCLTTIGSPLPREYG